MDTIEIQRGQSDKLPLSWNRNRCWTTLGPWSWTFQFQNWDRSGPPNWNSISADSDRWDNGTFPPRPLLDSHLDAAEPCLRLFVCRHANLPSCRMHVGARGSSWLRSRAMQTKCPTDARFGAHADQSPVNQDPTRWPRRSMLAMARTLVIRCVVVLTCAPAPQKAHLQQQPELRANALALQVTTSARHSHTSACAAAQAARCSVRQRPSSRGALPLHIQTFDVDACSGALVPTPLPPCRHPPLSPFLPVPAPPPPLARRPSFPPPHPPPPRPITSCAPSYRSELTPSSTWPRLPATPQRAQSAAPSFACRLSHVLQRLHQRL
jgi:hypothetical protein